MEFFKKTNINFLGIRKWTALLSTVLVILSFVSIFTKGLNWGLDFTGGYAIQANYQYAPNLDKVRASLEASGLKHINVITFGSTKDIMIRLAPQAIQSDHLMAHDQKTEQQALRNKFDCKFAFKIIPDMLKYVFLFQVTKCCINANICQWYERFEIIDGIDAIT